MSTQPDTLLTIDGLKTWFDSDEGAVRAVDGVSFAVRRGTTLGVVGESGCGKSMTSLSIMRLVPRPRGRIADGTITYHRDTGTAVEITALDAFGPEMRDIRGNDIAMIFQEPMTSLNPVYTVGDQIMESVRLHQGAAERQARERAVEMLRLVGIPAAEQRIREYPHQLSGGMRQRVMIAIALSCDPSFLIADEPTTALDVTIEAQILELMQSLQQRLGMAIMFITHDLGVIGEMADEVVVMYAGKIVEHAPVLDIFDRPQHPYTQGLLNSRPVIGARRRLAAIEGTVPHLAHLPPGCSFAARCNQAMEVCEREEPAPFAAGTDHTASCWLAEGGAEAGEAASRTGSPAGDTIAGQAPDSAANVGGSRGDRAHESTATAGGGTAAGDALAPARPTGPGFGAQRAGAPAASSGAAAEPGMPAAAAHSGSPGAARQRAPQSAARGVENGGPLLRVTDLKKHFPVHRGLLRRTVGWVRAVDGITFTVGAGETVGLVGESGCGKSTTGRTILRLLDATSGEMLFRSDDSYVDLATVLDRQAMKRVRRRMQIIFQDPFSSLDPRMTVRDIVDEPMRAQKMGAAAVRHERVERLLELVGLNAWQKNRYPHEFSGGQRQRIGIARALAVGPSLLVCDEPVSALDVSVQA
ncbi:MAG: ABC transporter ATP-binding protein, partial [Spirochaetaceae bacterium]|nr:ABC transporter ATP-binding protein [Spirochaetaceae bacterium]